ncbi:MAG TPA: hypothetical protein VNI01_06950 [Elusimicrobiota bacterium]|jgi:hypothetical protein|nr:hypothetical protein [Elusimicrobiota bacterium]
MNRTGAKAFVWRLDRAEESARLWLWADHSRGTVARVPAENTARR